MKGRRIGRPLCAEIITLRAIALKLFSPRNRWNRWNSRDHNATSYSTETRCRFRFVQWLLAEIITLRAIALKLVQTSRQRNDHAAEIITLRAIALKHFRPKQAFRSSCAEIITLRAIALKLFYFPVRGHLLAEIITLRAIALKPGITLIELLDLESRDHNATSYSTETRLKPFLFQALVGRDHNATSYSTETGR